MSGQKTTKTQWAKVAGGVFEKKMPWGGKLTVWEGPNGRSYTCEHASGSQTFSMGWSDKTRDEIAEGCLEDEAEDHAQQGFPEKVERERLETIKRWEDEKRAQDNYEAALKLLDKCKKGRASDLEIQAFLDYDAALRKVGEAKVERERASHIERQRGW